MSSLAIGIGWNTNLVCGQMSLTKRLQDQLNGVTTGFQQIMSTVIQNASGAVASLPALIIQRAASRGDTCCQRSSGQYQPRFA